MATLGTCPRQPGAPYQGMNLQSLHVTRATFREGLYLRSGTYAQTKGVWNHEIEIDPVVLTDRFPGCVWEFCLLHETAHALGRHNLWRMNIVKWLLLPLYPLIVRYQEGAADRYALERMSRRSFAIALAFIHERQEHWFWRFTYGVDWVERFWRAVREPRKDRRGNPRAPS